MIRRVFVFLTVVSLALTGTASAAELQAYSATALQKAQTDGKTVALVFHAVWCGTCRAQSAALRDIAAEDPFGAVVFLKVDYDKEDALKTALSVRSQSTLIVFKGREERARGVGVVDRDEIRALIRKAL